jgi:archaellum biogenesis ATPase FlaH
MRPHIIEQIRNEARDLNDRNRKNGTFPQGGYPHGPDAGLLRTKPANEWMKLEYGKSPAKKLFGSLWFEGELCILFADTNMGKSILAVQIGDSLTREGTIEPLANEAPAGTKVLYIDFELSARQFHSRYVDSQWGSYQFADSFYRSEFNPAADNPAYYTDYEDFIKDSISNVVSNLKARILIIDNITYVSRGTQQAGKALQLMKTLKALKKQHSLSILVLAHTPKRNPYKPITVNDLQGSKMLINFADSAFAIGQSHSEPGTRYLKQIKQRNQKEEYGETNVCLMKQESTSTFYALPLMATPTSAITSCGQMPRTRTYD